MNASTQTYVLDASAAVDYIDSGPGAPQIELKLADGLRQQRPLLMSVVNLGEVFYLSWQRSGEEKARQTVARLSRLPLLMVPVDLPQALKASELKAIHKLPYVDAIAAALALQHRATLVTADRDFEKLGRHFSVMWLPRR